MSVAKKASLVFLALVNIMNIAAGIIAQVKMLLGSDVTSIIPITINLSVNQVLLLNLFAVVLVIFLISVITTYLVTDIAYSPIEIITNCPFVALIIPLALFIFSAVNAVRTPLMADKICIIVMAALYVLASAFNFGAMVTIRED